MHDALRGIFLIAGLLGSCGGDADVAHGGSAKPELNVDLLAEAPGPPPPGMVWIPGGLFRMGSPNGFPDERPVHWVALRGFYMDRTEVTNADFARFVEETGYTTVAERAPEPEELPGVPLEELVPGSLVFRGEKVPGSARSAYELWEFVEGAYWRAPEGPGSDIADRMDHPVVHLAWDDAVAYARWDGKRLPTEAEWERAARGGLEQATYPWGDDLGESDCCRANYWQGVFPEANRLGDGYASTAPVGSFRPNGYGLHDIAGNVWEWCADWYRPDAYRSTQVLDPPGPSDSFDPDEPGVPKRVLRGGSFLCSQNYCTGYRVAARMKQDPRSSLNHLGFRCVRDVPEPR